MDDLEWLREREGFQVRIRELQFKHGELWRRNQEAKKLLMQACNSPRGVTGKLFQEIEAFLNYEPAQAEPGMVTIKRSELALLLREFHDGNKKEWAIYDRLKAELAVEYEPLQVKPGLLFGN